MICQTPCKFCTDNTSCLSCVDGDPGENREGPDLDCQCLSEYSPFELWCIGACPIGQFGVGRSCLNCHLNCLTCAGSASFCTSCADGYYDHNSICQECSHTCF